MRASGHFDCSIDFPQAAVSPVHTVYIPFSLVGQLIVVQARVESRSGNFIFDTGAERLLLNTKHFDRRGGGPVTALGNTGNVGNVRWYQVDSLHLDPLFLLKKEAHLTDLSHIEQKKHTIVLGILGYDVFRDFEVFIDFQNFVIVLRKVNAAGNRIDSIAWHEQPADSITFALKKHLIMIEVTVNGVKMKMILDSGAELNLLDRRVNRKVLDQFSIIKRVTLSGVGTKEVEVLAGILKEVTCGKQHEPAMNTLLTSLDEINASFGTTAVGVLGYEFINNKRMLINYQKQKLYFYQPLRP